MPRHCEELLVFQLSLSVRHYSCNIVMFIRTESESICFDLVVGICRQWRLQRGGGFLGLPPAPVAQIFTISPLFPYKRHIVRCALAIKYDGADTLSSDPLQKILDLRLYVARASR